MREAQLVGDLAAGGTVLSCPERQPPHAKLTPPNDESPAGLGRQAAARMTVRIQ
jgi:hypothetical protein